MAIQTTYSQARANLAKLCDKVSGNREIVIINRRNAEDVAIIAAGELSGIIETAHLLRSPRNARRLLTALNRSQEKKLKPQTIQELRREIGLNEEK
ncbi:MAG: type II toxin-antitoxin system Phd/YefM family antitoxin [Proteobacteria bacterium]|nr:type II toxin-antitoxin system Phd/YefM family antitoxin [Pseudomonadota bacterium]